MFHVRTRFVTVALWPCHARAVAQRQSQTPAVSVTPTKMRLRGRAAAQQVCTHVDPLILLHTLDFRMAVVWRVECSRQC